MGEIKAFGENVSFYLVINWFTFLLYPALHYEQNLLSNLDSWSANKIKIQPVKLCLIKKSL